MLKLVLRQENRWDSTFRMVKQFIALLPHIDRNIYGAAVPSATEVRKIEMLLEGIGAFAYVSKFLQSDGVTVSTVCDCFDLLIDAYPGSVEYLATDAQIVKSTICESACVKVARQENLQPT